MPTFKTTVNVHNTLYIFAFFLWNGSLHQVFCRAVLRRSACACTSLTDCWNSSLSMLFNLSVQFNKWISMAFADDSAHCIKRLQLIIGISNVMLCCSKNYIWQLRWILTAFVVFCMSVCVCVCSLPTYKWTSAKLSCSGKAVHYKPIVHAVYSSI